MTAAERYDARGGGAADGTPAAEGEAERYDTLDGGAGAGTPAAEREAER